MTLSITAHSIVARNADILDAECGEQRILFHPVEGLYCDLDKVGAYIWRLLVVARDFEQLIAMLAVDFSADRAICRADTHAFLTLLAQRGFIRVEQRQH